MIAQAAKVVFNIFNAVLSRSGFVLVATLHGGFGLRKCDAMMFLAGGHCLNWRCWIPAHW